METLEPTPSSSLGAGEDNLPDGARSVDSWPHSSAPGGARLSSDIFDRSKPRAPGYLLETAAQPPAGGLKDGKELELVQGGDLWRPDSSPAPSDLVASFPSEQPKAGPPGPATATQEESVPPRSCFRNLFSHCFRCQTKTNYM